MGCLILHQRYKKRYARYLSLAQDVATSFNEQNQEAETSTNNLNPAPSTSTTEASNKPQKCGGLPTIKEGCCEDSPLVDIEDIATTNRRDSKGILSDLMPEADDMYVS